MEDSWILGMIHRGHASQYSLEKCYNSRNKDTLIALLKKHVAVGREIHTFCWKGYINCAEYGYVHETVNHPEEFVNSKTHSHTQDIESSWMWMRRFHSRGGV